MRILHIVRGLANSSGVTHIVGPLAEAQANLGHDLHVYFVEKPGRSAVVPDPQRVDSRCFPMTVSSNHFGWSRALQRSLHREVRKFDIVHIHSIWNFPTLCGMRECWRAGVPYLVAPQGSLEPWALGRHPRLKGWYGWLCEQPYLNRAARLQAVTLAEAEQCEAFAPGSRPAVLPNGVDLELIDRSPRAADLRSELNLPPHEILLLFVGRLFPKKGLDLLAEAFGRLCRERQDVTLLIAGHDAGTGYRQEVESMLRRHGADSKTHFLGEVQGERKYEVLRGADLFVLSSYSEGLPVAVLEAMGVGCPVLITPGCHLPEVEEDEAGWIADTNPGALHEVLQQALISQGERQRRGARARALVESKFTWQVIAERSLELYREILAERGASVDRAPALSESIAANGT